MVSKFSIILTLSRIHWLVYKLFYSVLGGTLLALAFVSEWTGVLVFIGLALLKFAITTNSNKLNYLLNLLFWLTFFLINFDYIYVSATIIPYLALTIVESLIMSLSYILYRAATGLLQFVIARTLVRGNLRVCSITTTNYAQVKSIYLDATLLAIAITILELARSNFPFGGIGFGKICYTMAYLPFSSLAYLVGEAPITFVVAFFGILLCNVFQYNIRTFNHKPLEPKTKTASLIKFFICSNIACIIIFGIQYCQYQATLYNPAPTTLKVLVVQPNANQVAFGMDSDISGVFNRSLDLTESALNDMKNLSCSYDEEGNKQGSCWTNIDLIVWPENAIEYDIYNPKNVSVVNQIKEFEQQWGIPILAGTSSIDTNVIPDTPSVIPAFSSVIPAQAGIQQNAINQPPGQKLRLNRYQLFDSRGVTDTFYDKKVPVPFGEYLPFRNLIAKFSDIGKEIPIDMKPGVGEKQTISINLGPDNQSVKIGILTCFEISNEGLAQQLRQENPDFIISPSNNIFFGYSSEAFQQLSIAKFRANELGKPLIQVSTTGYSANIRFRTRHLTNLYHPEYFTTYISIPQYWDAKTFLDERTFN
jgi:apolipoprotein N-acyltransferase